MDIDLILEGIFEEYKTKAIREGRSRKLVEERLQVVREQMEATIKDATDDFIGRPNNDATRVALRQILNQELNKFLDTEITIDSIQADREMIEVNMTYRPKTSLETIEVTTAITALSGNPGQDIIPLQL